MFEAISPRYDLMNRVMSARRDVAWRRFTMRRLPWDDGRILDVATGTGDLALEIARGRPGAWVVGVDFSPAMLRSARRKARQQGRSTRLHLALADALNLPFPDQSFNAAAIAFGLRNIPDQARALTEMRRVVKPGGQVLVPEMTSPHGGRFKRSLDWYTNRVIPLLGGLIAGNYSAYSYLPTSIYDFHDPEELTKMMHAAGLVDVRYFRLSHGITNLHEGIVPF